MHDKKNQCMTNKFRSRTSSRKFKTNLIKNKTERLNSKSNRKKVKTEDREFETNKKHPQNEDTTGLSILPTRAYLQSLQIKEKCDL